MTAIVGGLLAALFWGTAPLLLTRASRRVGAQVATAWVLTVGFAIAAVAGLVAGQADDLRDGLDLRSGALLAVASVGVVGGLRTVASALAKGRLSIVAPIASSQGAVAAGIAILLGEEVAAGVLVGLAAVAIGVIVVASGRSAEGDAPGEAGVAVIGLALLACGFFSLTLVAGGPAGEELGAFSVAAVTRLVGVLVLGLPLLLAGRLGAGRGDAPLLLVAGLLDVGGYLAFLIAAGDGVAVPSVLAGQSAAIAAVLGVALLGERLRRPQVAGIALVLLGVLVVSLARS